MEPVMSSLIGMQSSLGNLTIHYGRRRAPVYIHRAARPIQRRELLRPVRAIAVTFQAGSGHKYVHAKVHEVLHDFERWLSTCKGQRGGQLTYLKGE